MNPRDWYEWGALFADQQEVIAKKHDERDFLKTSEPPDEAFDTANLATTPEIELAIQHFAASQQWPELTSLAGALLLSRLSAAYWLARSLLLASQHSLLPASPPKDWDFARTLDFFLAKAWNDIGGGIQSRIIDLLPGDNSTTPEPGNPHANN